MNEYVAHLAVSLLFTFVLFFPTERRKILSETQDPEESFENDQVIGAERGSEELPREAFQTFDILERYDLLTCIRSCLERKTRAIACPFADKQ